MTVDDPLDFRLVDSAGRCRACGCGVGEMPGTARFCPDCGAHVRPPLGRVARVRRRLDQIHFWRRPRTDPFPAGPPTRILVGYGNALFSLGWRYERGRSGPRNLPEAIRCYRKSARLGNRDAVVRLTSANSVDLAGAVPVVPLRPDGTG